MKKGGYFLSFPLICLTFVLLLQFGTALASDGESNPPTITTVDTLLFENFNGPEGPFVNNPLPEWTVIDSGVSEWDATSWSRYYNTPYPQYWNGDLARVLFSGTGAIGDWLITPSFDCSSDNVLTFSFKQSHSNRSTSDNDTIFVYGSTNGGATWSETIYMSTETRGALNAPDTVIQDISSWAGGQSNVRIAFYFKGNNVLTWYLDEPYIQGNVNDTIMYEDFNGVWGEFGNNPPAGWSIINEITPDAPNANDWSRWYYSTWPDTVALAYDNANNQTANEWFISPTLSFSANAICSLTYYNSYWDDSADPSDSAFVLGSTNGGATWDHLVVSYGAGDDRSTNRGQSWRGFDISSWAQGQSNVKLGFHYIKDDPSYIGWWFFDDLTVYEASVGNDNVAAISFDYPEGFVVVGTSYDPMITLQNLSTNPQTVSLNLTVTDAGDVEVYNYTETGIAMAALEILQVTIGQAFIPATTGNHEFVAVVINPGDEDLSDDTTGAIVPAYQHEGTGGPDDFGYMFIDNTEAGGPVYNWIEISETGVQTNPTDHYFMSPEISIGFPFDLYGVTHNSIWINSHGELHLGVRDSWLSANDCPLPDPSTPHAPLLAVFWDLLYVHHEIGQGVYYQYFDQGENDYFVVQWEAKVGSAGADSVIFEAILHQNGDIVYQYKYVNDGSNGRGQGATTGMEYDVLPAGISYNCNDGNPANRLQNGLAIKWYLGASPSGTLSGTVKEIDDTTPISDVAVSAYDSGNNLVGSDNTDGDGLFSFTLDPGTYSLAFSKAGYADTTVTGLIVVADETTDIVVLMNVLAGCDYFIGDVNGSGTYNGLDITFGVLYFKGGNPPGYECECTPGNTWFVSGDVNGSCSYNGLDITYGVAYLKGGPSPIPCGDCPPIGRLAGNIDKPVSDAVKENSPK